MVYQLFQSLREDVEAHLHPASGTVLCDACQGMFKIWNRPQHFPIIGTQAAFDAVRPYGKLDYFSANNMRRHHSSPADMQAAADQGCQICIVLCEHWAQLDKSERRRISAFVSVIQQPICGFIQMQAKPGMRLWWLDFWRNSRSFALWLRYRRMFSLYRVQQLAKNEATTVRFQFGDADDRTVVLELHPHLDWWHTSTCTTCDGCTIHELSDSTGSPDTIAQIQRWYASCVEGHPDCSPRKLLPTAENSDWMPTRLINVDQSKASQKCILQLSSELSPASYMTLSHCWGEANGPRPPKLTDSNVDSMRNRIPIETLPRTFQDAIQITRNLGVSYLWIDSLCIIQDSLEDWRRESRLMDKVYRYSACNIMAEAATNCDGGLFFRRDPQRLGIFTLNEKQTSSLSHRSTICITQDYVNVKSDRGKGSPLYSRGWVCQERWLAPRQISFHNNQVFWECKKLKACEAFPSWEAKLDHDEDFPTRRGSFQPRCKSIVFPPAHTVNRRDTFSFSWRTMVESYTTCTLTEEQDKLIAIQGLVNIYKSLQDDDYLAGLWRKRLLSGLMWTTRSGLQANGEPSYRPETYRAPSWSWASVEGTIEMLPEIRPEEERRVELCRVLEAKTTPLGEDTTGQVSDGYIRLRGRLLSTEDLSFHTSPKGKVVEIARSRDGDPSKSWINCQIDDMAQWSPRNNVLLPVLQCDHRSPQSCMLKGLVLVPVEGHADKYERIGTWNDNANREGVDPFGWFKEAAEQEERDFTLV